MQSVSLSRLARGEQGKVKSIVAGSYATKRLYELGLNTGASFQVLKNDRGPIIISLSGNKIALGRGIAEKVMISK